MLRKIALLVAVSLWSSSSLLLPQDVSAQTALTRAVIESLKNQVRLIPKNQSARSARPSDAMTPGDALATAKASTAQLRFNDGSLARLGEQAVFSFSPGTRTFALSNGTALMLIPPGRGTTRVRTPNAAAGIRGSALFVRYIPETNTTIIGALTTSGIEVFNEVASQRQELKAGNMAVIVKDRIEKVYEFDLKTFYQTSELVSGLDLTRSKSTPSSDEAIAQVQAETSQALQAQSPIAGERVIENPSFIQVATSRAQDFPDVGISVINGVSSSAQQNFDFIDHNFAYLRNNLEVMSLLVGGQIQSTQAPLGIPSIGNPVTGSIPNAVQTVTGSIPNAVQPVTGSIPNAVNSAANSIPNAVNSAANSIPNAVNSAANSIPNVVNSAANSIPNVVNSVTNDISNAVKPVTDSIPNAVNSVTNVFPGQGNGVQNGFPGQGNGVQNGFPGQGNGVQNGFPGQGNGVQNGFPGQGNGVKNGFSGKDQGQN